MHIYCDTYGSAGNYEMQSLWSRISAHESTQRVRKSLLHRRWRLRCGSSRRRIVRSHLRGDFRRHSRFLLRCDRSEHLLGDRLHIYQSVSKKALSVHADLSSEQIPGEEKGLAGELIDEALLAGIFTVGETIGWN